MMIVTFSEVIGSSIHTQLNSMTSKTEFIIFGTKQNLLSGRIELLSLGGSSVSPKGSVKEYWCHSWLLFEDRVAGVYLV